MSGAAVVVSERIHALMDELTAAERRVARALLADYPAAGLGSSRSLAADSGVSTPTVVRTAVRLGFGGFVEMQAQLRDEVSGSAGSPLLRTKAHAREPRGGRGFAQAMRQRVAAIEATLGLIPDDEVRAAVRLIAECPADVLVTGGFFSGALARVMSLQLSQLRRGVVFVEEPLSRDAGLVIDAKRRSVLVLFDMRRYEAKSLELAHAAKRAGLATVLVTDRWMSPIASVADVVLPVEVESVPFDTFAAALALVEAIVDEVADTLGPRAVKRMEQWESTATDHTAARALSVPTSADRPTSA